jgi:hypothetical protein
MFSLIVYLAPFLLGVLLLVSLIGAYTNLRRARKAPYFRIRRDATRAGWRWVLLVVVCAGGITASLRVRQLVPPPRLEVAFPRPPEPTPTFSLDAILSVTDNLSLTPKPLFEAPPTITPTVPTPTLTPTPPIATVVSVVTPPANAVLRITAISSDISSALEPVNVNTTFPAGIPRLYYWIEFSNMANGLSWSRVLLLNGNVIRSESETWERGTEGIAYYWFEAQGGWPAGEYEIRFYIGDRLAASQTYTLVD